MCSVIRSFLCFLAVVVWSLPGTAQSGRLRPGTTGSSGSESKPAGGPSDVSLETTEVIVPVTVRTRAGRLIPNLSRQDFTVYEDGIRQEITDFTAEAIPANVVLLIDASGSVQTEINDIRLSALAFINVLGNKDQVSIMRFNDRVELVEDWTKDKLRLERALLQMPATGNTKFFNALADAADRLSKTNGRRAVILFTDGVDTYEGKDRKSPDEAITSILRAEAIVYVISKTRAVREIIQGARSPWLLRPIDPRDPFLKAYLETLDQAEDWLTKLADRTGGAIFFPLEQSELKTVYGQIAEELNRQYVLRYYPRNRRADATYRRIRVSTGNPDYIAYAREGYYAPKAEGK